MKAVPRILANLLLPPFVATLLLLVLLAASSGIPPSRDIVMIISYAYLFAAVPSILHALVMERFYRRGVLPARARAVVVSTVSGLCAGILLSIVFAVSTSVVNLELLWLYPGLGAATGAVIALMILGLSRSQQKNA